MRSLSSRHMRIPICALQRPFSPPDAESHDQAPGKGGKGRQKSTRKRIARLASPIAHPEIADRPKRQLPRPSPRRQAEPAARAPCPVRWVWSCPYPLPHPIYLSGAFRKIRSSPPLPPPGEDLGLCDPLVALNPALELQPRIDPSDLCLGPACDLPEMPHAQFVQPRLPAWGRHP